MKILKATFIFFIFCQSLSAVTLNDDSVPEFAVIDFRHDIQESDFIQVSDEEKKSILKELVTEKLTLSRSEQIQNRLLGKETKPTQTSSHAGLQLLEIHPDRISPNSQHAIHPLANYSQNRIGRGTFKHIQNQNVEVYVFGGSPEFIENYKKKIGIKKSMTIDKLPSLYEEWGLYKFHVKSNSSKEKEKMIWVVPPSLEYVRHYATLFSIYSKNKVVAGIDEDYLKIYEQQLKENLAKIKKSSGLLDYVVFGYERNWMKLIEEQFQGSLIDVNEIKSLNQGVTFKVVTLKINNNEQTPKIRIGFFGSGQTVWGRLAAMQLSSLVHSKLKAVLFLGSAGATGKEISVYDLSVPQKFVRKGRKVNMENFILNQNAQTQAITDYGQSIHFHSKHGNTYSPIEQDKNYLRQLNQVGIQTVDVEQSLVAEAISDFNLKNKSKVQFGAVNVITDKPIAILSAEKSHSDLDKVDHSLKEKARRQAVQLALKAIMLYEQKNVLQMSCKDLFLK